MCSLSAHMVIEYDDIKPPATDSIAFKENTK
jgi:hypothetical protein